MGYVPNGFGEIVIRYGFTDDPEDKTISLGFRSTLGAAQADLETAGLAVWAEYIATFHSTGEPTMAVPWELRGFVMRTRAADVDYLAEGGTPVVGDATTNVVVTNSAVLVKKRTGLAGRGNRGRVFAPPFGLDEDNVTPGGIITAGIVDDYQDQWDAFLAGVQAADAELVVLHAMVLDDPGPPPVYVPPTDPPVDITNFIVQSKVATQRRRLR